MKKVLYTMLVATAMTMPAAAHANSWYHHSVKPAPANVVVKTETIQDTLDTQQVVELQKALKARGYYRGTADGVWGDNTEMAVRNFQRDNGMAATGSLNGRALEMLGVQVAVVDAPVGAVEKERVTTKWKTYQTRFNHGLSENNSRLGVTDAEAVREMDPSVTRRNTTYVTPTTVFYQD